MKLFKGLAILALLTGMTMQVNASEGSKEITASKEKPLSWIIGGGTTIKRPPINDDGPGGNGGK